MSIAAAHLVRGGRQSADELSPSLLKTDTVLACAADRFPPVGTRASVSNRRSGAGGPASLRVLYLRRRGWHTGGDRLDRTGLRVQLGRHSQSATARHPALGRDFSVEQSRLPARGKWSERVRSYRHGTGS